MSWSINNTPITIISDVIVPSLPQPIPGVNNGNNAAVQCVVPAGTAPHTVFSVVSAAQGSYILEVSGCVYYPESTVLRFEPVSFSALVTDTVVQMLGIYQLNPPLGITSAGNSVTMTLDADAAETRAYNITAIYRPVSVLASAVSLVIPSGGAEPQRTVQLLY